MDMRQILTAVVGAIAAGGLVWEVLGRALNVVTLGQLCGKLFRRHKPPQDATRTAEAIERLCRSRAASREGSLTAPLIHLPYRRNQYFTGRKAELDALGAALTQDGAAALSGLGGVGKTQIALTYAWDNHDAYPGGTFWITATSENDLLSGYAALAEPELLSLLVNRKTEKNLQAVADAVRARLAHEERPWLVVFDNADDPSILKPFIPANPHGRVIITSKAQNFAPLNVRCVVGVKEMIPNDGRDFLLARVTRDERAHTPDEVAAAENLAKELGYFPLALEQAGAYIAAMHTTFRQYLSAYHRQRLRLLGRRKPEAGDYRETVATTWRMSFREVRRASKAAADALAFSAFLAPDGIPFELLILGAPHLGRRIAAALLGAADEPGRVNELLEPLTRFSLIRVDGGNWIYAVHRLVQEVTRWRMGGAECRTWAERTVRAVNAAFPLIEFENWRQCDRLLPHAQAACELVVSQLILSREAGRLLNQTAYRLDDRAQHAEAEPLYGRALEIRQKVLGPEHPDTATSLDNLAGLYDSQGRYAEAEPLHRRALEIGEKALGPEHPHTATSLNNLAELYRAQGRYAEAEPLYQRALGIRHKVLGPEHPDTATSLNNLAELYRAQGRYAEAEPLHQRAVAIDEEVHGPDHPDVATSLNNLAAVYHAQGRLADAEPLFRRALEIREKMLRPEHPHTASSLNNVAELYRAQGRYAEAEPLYRRALGIWEKVLGPGHPSTATSLNNLALLYDTQGRYADAEPLYRRALEIREKVLGPEHPDTATSVNNLGVLLGKQGRYTDALPLLERALAIREKALGSEHLDTAHGLENCAYVLRRLNRDAEAAALKARAAEIRRKHAEREEEARQRART